MSAARQGREREWTVIHDLEAHGWQLVSRSAGSKGAADAVMVHPDRGLALVQVKKGKTGLGPAERERLWTLGHLCSAEAVLARVDRGRIVYSEVGLFGGEEWTP